MIKSFEIMHKPVWFSEKEVTEMPQLTENLKTDVVIVGGGLAGIFCSYLLAKEGKKVVLLEKNRIGSGQTGYTTAFITYVVDSTLSKMSTAFGEENAKLVWDAGRTAIAEMERIISREKIECDFLRCVACEFALKQEDAEILKKEAVLGQKLGFAVSFKNDAKLDFENFGYLEILEQAKFHPLKFLHQLAKKAQEAGVLIFENSEVLGIEEGNSIQAKTEKGIIEAEYAIIDTYKPFSSSIFPDQLMSFQTYVISLIIKKNIIKEAIYWDTEKPYTYFRLDTSENFDRLVLGGRDHLTGQDPNPDKHFDELENYFKKNFKDVEYKIEASWNGEILESSDGIAYIGTSALNPSILLNTGFSGNGMTFSVISAILNRDIIMGKANKYKALFDPGRIGGTDKIVKQEYLSQTPEFRDEEIPSNSGKIIKINGENVAVYKDEEGKIHKLSPICTHLGCTVGWNDNAKTWDCPCHGSRYAKDGNVINGPAKKPLNEI